MKNRRIYSTRSTGPEQFRKSSAPKCLTDFLECQVTNKHSEVCDIYDNLKNKISVTNIFDMLRLWWKNCVVFDLPVIWWLSVLMLIISGAGKTYSLLHLIKICNELLILLLSAKNVYFADIQFSLNCTTVYCIGQY